MTRRARLPLVLLLTVLVAACSGGDGSSSDAAPAGEVAVEDGQQRVQRGPVTLTVPAGLEQTRDTPTATEWYAPAGPSGRPDRGLSLLTGPLSAPTVEEVAAQAQAETFGSFAGIELVGQSEVEVPGADGARRLEFALAAGGAEQPGGTLHDLVLVVGEQQVVVRYSSNDASEGSATADEVFASVEVS